MPTTEDEGVPILRIADEAAKSSASIAPTRGAIVTRFAVHGRELLYLDPATLADPKANVRGGVPLLFPSPGKLANDGWARAGRHGAMKQHGFARTRPWELLGREAESATLRLVYDDATLAQYPWRFQVEIHCILVGATLRLDVRVQNQDASPMPFGFGIHPYFAVPAADKAKVRIPTTASRAFDNVQKKEVAFTGFDFTEDEVDLHLIDHGSSEASLELPDGARVTIAGSPEFTRWVVWSVAGKDFICLEPWTCPGDALNTGEGLIELAPGEERRLWLGLTLG